MVGGLTICLGFFLTVFAPNIIYLYFSYGILVGRYYTMVLKKDPCYILNNFNKY